jgi:hypothetical protein
MADPTHCVRCGGQAEPGSTEFLDWQIAENNAVICPRCLTPLDHTEHGEARSLTQYRDDEVLRELDPDNDDARCSRTSLRAGPTPASPTGCG